MKKNEQCLREMWETMKYNNMCIMGVPEGKERERKRKKYSKK